MIGVGNLICYGFVAAVIETAIAWASGATWYLAKQLAWDVAIVGVAIAFFRRRLRHRGPAAQLWLDVAGHWLRGRGSPLWPSSLRGDRAIKVAIRTTAAAMAVAGVALFVVGPVSLAVGAAAIALVTFAVAYVIAAATRARPFVAVAAFDDEFAFQPWPASPRVRLIRLPKRPGRFEVRIEGLKPKRPDERTTVVRFEAILSDVEAATLRARIDAWLAPRAASELGAADV